jgi:hypothetical protein
MLYSNLKKLVQQAQGPQGTVEIRMPKSLYDHLLRAALMSSKFDEQWYLKNNPDVASAVRSKIVASGREHYVNTGYFEGRLPCEIAVNEDFYVKKNDDVKRAMRAKQVKSAKEHWYSNGMKEGRDPSENFSLFGS